MTCQEFAVRFSPRAPDRAPANQGELRQLGPADGVKYLGPPPPDISERRVPKRSGDPGCHLWVILPGHLPFILERAAVRPPLESGVAKHTNLTGGGVACSGGELWLDPADSELLYMNGCSGRYGARTAVELEDVVVVFRTFGYQVVSFGWDEGANRPARVMRQ